ncbi:MAG: sulfotransferase [Pseudomonadota bacterium]
MSHPLNGANLKTLLTVARTSGGPDAAKILPFVGICASVLGRTPISWLERAALAPVLPKAADLPPPVFILGHWRSGTTHLYNIMSLGEFSYVPPVATGMPWDFIGLGRALRPVLEKALPKHRYIDAIPVTPDSPQEDEIALASMNPISFYHGIYFPRQFDHHLRKGLFLEDCTAAEKEGRWAAFVYFLRKLAYQQKQQLLIKNPVYTGMVADLIELFPNAKFIHIHRNPFDVFLSMRNFYRKLLPVFALQDFQHVDIDRTVLSVYSRMMERFEADTASLKAPQFVELGYDTLDRDPLAAVRTIYETLELDGFEQAEPAFAAYLSTIRSYEKNRFKGTPQDVEQVEHAWAHFIRKWDYSAPDLAPG